MRVFHTAGGAWFVAEAHHLLIFPVAELGANGWAVLGALAYFAVALLLFWFALER